MKKDITLTQKEFTRRIAGTTGMANDIHGVRAIPEISSPSSLIII